LAQKHLALAIEQAREAGLLGRHILGTEFCFDLSLVSGTGAFVSGEETALINALEGRIAEPDPRPPYPSESGLYGRPTCINNVETWANVPPIIDRGADEFTRVGLGDNQGTKLFCLVGDIERTGLVEVPLGVSLSKIINDIGGGARGGMAVKAVQTGGPSGGCIPAARLDLPADYKSLQSAGSIMGSGGLVVLSEKSCLVDVARYFLDFTKDESCGKCTPCREGIEHLSRILDKIVAGQGCEEDLDRLVQMSGGIARASLCGLGQSAPNPVLTTLDHFRNEYEAHVRDGRCPAGVCHALLTYTIDPELCTGCSLCVDECPVDAVSGRNDDTYLIDASMCTKCGACYEVCTFEAIRRE
jgi:NADH:ubiquinone oxidoreductase subunit F (NADH-binding)/NAD-dependent dihydropyrimidine dehydrogenase PreA subunit